MINEDRKRQIVAAFQRSFKQEKSKEIEGFALDELKDTDAMLGDRDLNAGFRTAICNRISFLEARNQKKHDSKVRASGYVMGILTSLLVYGAARWLFG